MTSPRNAQALNPQRIELAYVEDPSAYFQALAERPWAIWLDSGRPHSRQGRYDIMAAAPMSTVVCEGEQTQICRHGVCELSQDDPFDCLRRELLPWQPGEETLPLSGGALGYFSYDLARRLECLPTDKPPGEAMPEMAVGIYDWVLVVDHELKSAWIRISGRDPHSQVYCRSLAQQLGEVQPAVSQGFASESAIEPCMGAEDYAQAFKKVKHYIQEGDCYQVNLAQRYALKVSGKPWAIYQVMRRQNPAPHASYFSTPYGEILSASPERFLKLAGGEVETRPIKGTRARREDPRQDREQALRLKASQKDRAENLMIVDLLRNDLGKCCETGSIEVTALFEVESFATVHHLVSTIRGRLEHRADALSLLRACFPGGSITGAPKLRAMAIIDELETHRRGVYCGTLGYIGFNGQMDTNIAIRTLVHQGGNVSFWAGGGIVYDSRVEAEYKECHDKAAAFFRLFES